MFDMYSDLREKEAWLMRHRNADEIVIDRLSGQPVAAVYKWDHIVGGEREHKVVFSFPSRRTNGN